MATIKLSELGEIYSLSSSSLLYVVSGSTSYKITKENALSDVYSMVGDITQLTTTNKTSLVDAVNELNTNIGNLTTLTTTNKTSVVNAINEVDTRLDDSGWINLTPSKGTWNILRVRKVGDFAYIEGDATAYTWSGSAETFATLPEGYRPAWHKYTYGFSNGKTLSRIYVATGGVVGVDWLININGATNYTSQVWFRFYCVYAVA